MTLQDVCSIRELRGFQANDKKSMSGHCCLNLKVLSIASQLEGNLKFNTLGAA